MNTDKKSTLINFVIDTAIGILYCWSISSVLSGFAYMDFSLGTTFLWSSLFVLAFRLLLTHWMVAVSGFTVIALAAVYGTVTHLEEIRQLATVLLQNLPFDDWMFFPILLLMVGVAALFTSISLHFSFRFPLMGIVGAILCCTVLFQGDVQDSQWYLFLFTILLLCLMHFLSRKQKKNPRAKWKTFLVAVPVSAAAVLLAFLVCLPFQASQGWMNADSILHLFDRFQLNYENTVRLGGSFDLDDTPVFYVETEYPQPLFSGVSDVYTGRSWEKSQNERASFQNGYNTMDAAFLLNLSTQPFTRGNIQMGRMEITYLQPSKQLFVPRLSTAFQVGDNPVYLNRMGEFSVGNTIRQDSTISVQYVYSYLPSQYGGRLTTAMEENAPELDWPNVLADYNGTLYQTFGSEQIQEYRDYIQEQYTQLPSSVTDRTRELARQITQDASTDSEKAEAIRRYLATNFSYTLHPNNPPGGQDFVDFFLFEEQQGYCESFATAMAVLSRCVNLPARYVYGYSMQGVTDGTIRQNNAHAWAEVYIDGYGWCPFESTPPYVYAQLPGTIDSFSVDVSNRQEMEQHLANLGLGEMDVTALEEEESSSQPQDTSSQSSSSESSEESSSSASSEPSFGTSSGSSMDWNLLGRLLILVGILALAALSLYLRARTRVRREMRETSLGANRWADASFRRIAAIGKELGCPIQQGETVIAYLGRLSQSFPAMEPQLERIGSLVSKAEYSQSPITEKEAAEVYRAYQAMDQLLRSRTNRFRYFWKKYLLQRF